MVVLNLNRTSWGCIAQRVAAARRLCSLCSPSDYCRRHTDFRSQINGSFFFYPVWEAGTLYQPFFFCLSSHLDTDLRKREVLKLQFVSICVDIHKIELLFWYLFFSSALLKTSLNTHIINWCDLYLRKWSFYDDLCCCWASFRVVKHPRNWCSFVPKFSS